MGYRGKEYPISSFAGGWVSVKPSTGLKTSESPDLQNIILKPEGTGFRSRDGDTVYNSSAMASGLPVTGLQYFKTDAQAEFLIATAGTKIYKSELDGTMDDITGAITITPNQNNIWDIVPFNDKVYAFGGPPATPDAPWVWNASGNALALGGTPPSAYGAFQTQNRMFAFRTQANPSRIYWSILGNAEDWTGVGSGSADVWTSNNDRLNASAVLSTSTVLLFKDNSIHQMQTSNIVDGAFPIFPLFDNIGCAGKKAVVVFGGLAYFISTDGKMRITDGDKILTETELPNLGSTHDQWNQVNSARVRYAVGQYDHGIDYEHIHWIVSYGPGQASNNRSFIWDIGNKCWLQHATGYKANVSTRIPSGTIYMGHYDGKIYSKQTSGKATDDSEGGATVDGYWTSGWYNDNTFEKIKQPRKMTVSYNTQTAGNIRISYGFDFNDLGTTQTISQAFTTGGLWDVGLWDTAVWGSKSFNVSSFRILGRGNFFRYKIETPTAAYPMVINGLTVSGKEYGQKEVSST